MLLFDIWTRRQVAAIAQDARLGRVVLSCSQVIWDEVWQRPQEHALRTARDHVVVYVSPVQLHNWFWQLGRRFKAVQVFEQAAGGVLLILSPLIFSGHFKSRVVHSINSWLMAGQLTQMLAKSDAVYCISNTPFMCEVIQRLFFRPERAARLRRLVYDVIDDFTVFEWSPEFGKEMDAALVRMADAVLTGTQQLAKSRYQATFIPCGVDFKAFSAAKSAPADIADLRKPIIGYFGTISERVDLDLIAELCEKFIDASVVLIGPVHFQQHGIPHKPNLHYLGLKSHSEIPAYAQAFDMGLIPFRLTEATLQLHPVKTLEYLAAGVPVVSTALPDVEYFYAGIVDVAHSREEFLELVERRLALRDPDRIAAGIERARAASWEAMTERMNKLLLADDGKCVEKPVMTNSAMSQPQLAQGL